MFQRERRSSYNMSAFKYITVGALSVVHGAIAKNQVLAAVGVRPGMSSSPQRHHQGPFSKSLIVWPHSFIKRLLHICEPSPS